MVDLAADIDRMQNKILGGDEETKQQNSFESVAVYLSLGEQSKDKLLDMILRCAMYVVQAGGAGLTIFDKNVNKLVFRAAVGDGAEGVIGYEVPLEGSQHGLAFATGEIQSSTPMHSGIEKKSNVDFKNVLVAPLIVGEDAIGTISAVNKQKDNHFTPEDMAAYQLFSELAAQVVQQRLREETVLTTFSGKQIKEPAELGEIAVGADESQFIGVLQDVVSIYRDQPQHLRVCKQLTNSLLDKSGNGGGKND